MRDFFRLLRLIAPFWRWMGLAVLLGFATIGSGIGLMATAAYIISKAALQPSIAALQVSIAGVRFFGIGRGVFRYLERYVSHQATFRLLTRLRVWLYRAIEPTNLIQRRSGDLLSRMVADVESLEAFYIRVIAPPLTAGLVLGLAAGLMAAFDGRLAATISLFLLLVGLALPLFSRRLSRRIGPELVTTRADLNAALVDGIQGMAELLLAGRTADYEARLRRLSDRLADRQGQMAWLSGLHTALSGLLVDGAVLAILLIAIPLVRSGQIEGVYLALLVLVGMAAFEAALPLPETFQQLDSSLAAARRLFELVDTPPAVVDPPPPSPVPHDHSLAVEKLTFRYGPDQAPALREISFSLPAGGRLAIVGPSGAGKSTLLNLLLRFWEYETGQIRLGGYELRSYRTADLRRLMSVVSQRTHLFNDTIRGNLLLARPEATEAELKRAIRRAQLDGFIQELPEGYDTPVGEQGWRLSGGQRQRLAIARALLQDRPFLLLDEPTANLDALTERAILDALRPLMAGRTTLLVTHRLAGLETMDEILVWQAGRIAQRGRHAELLRADGLYRQLWNLQTII